MKEVFELKDVLPFRGSGDKDLVFANPPKIHVNANKADGTEYVNPDPYILEYNGRYYCFATGCFGVQILQSMNLTDWVHLGHALQDEAERNYWAPAVIYHNGLFYMYYSSAPKDSTDPHDEFMKVAVAENPEGPYEYKKTMFQTFSIDAHVIRGDDGEFYMFYSNNEFAGTVKIRPGTVILMDRLVDMYTPEGNPRLVVKPTIDEEIFAKNRFGDGRNWHTIEGAYYINRRGKHYCMYSGNAYLQPYYFIGYSMAEKNSGSNFLNELHWRKIPDDTIYSPLMKKNSRVEGVGHNSVMKAPNGIDDWIFYHGRAVKEAVEEQGREYVEEREMRLDPILWFGDKLFVPGPSSDQQLRPALPYFRELFEESAVEGLLGVNWINVHGDWKVSVGEAMQQSEKGIGSALAAVTATHYRLEVNVRWKYSHLGGRYGIYAVYADKNNNLQVLLDPGRRALVVFSVQNGVKSREETVHLEGDFNFRAYHKLTVIKTGSILRICVDGLTRTTVRSDIRGAVHFGLVTHYTMADYGGISMTPSFRVDEDNQDEIRSCLVTQPDVIVDDLSWEMKNGKLRCLPSSRGKEHSLFFIDDFKAENYRFQADVSPLNQSSLGGIGVYPYFKDMNNFILVTCEFTSGSEGKVFVKEVGEQETSVSELQVPISGKRFNSHTLYVRKFAEDLLVLLDEYVVCQQKVPKEAANIGLFSEREAQFDSFEWVQLN